MVIPGHEPMTPGERVLADRLAAELAVLLCGRDLKDAVDLLTSINHAMRVERHAAEPTRH